MQTILVTGATGLLGHALVPQLINGGYEVLTHGHTQAADVSADLTNRQAALNCLNNVAPDIVINLAALTNVDICESDVNRAYQINAAIVENIGKWIRQKKTQRHLIQISTDHVYDQSSGIEVSVAKPHQEEEVQLVNIYGLSKYAGELAAGQVNATVLRTNFFGKSHIATRPSFTDWIYQSLKAQQEIWVFTDVWFSPLSITSLIEMVTVVVDKKPQGTFNVGAHHGLSKADFAFQFAKQVGLDTSLLKPILSKDANFIKAIRPKDMRMDCGKFEQAMGIILPSLATEIKCAAREYYANV
jgi:dTDP-4-dehydrorhamnose reductase